MLHSRTLHLSHARTLHLSHGCSVSESGGQPNRCNTGNHQSHSPNGPASTALTSLVEQQSFLPKKGYELFGQPLIQVSSGARSPVPRPIPRYEMLLWG